tara:strand:+ start:386 stop:682 length:297 start_codon:yes stop_codon:yes gene_type:complete
MQHMKKFIIVARRWFERTNGNTYHSVLIIDSKTNEEIAFMPYTYGYDSHYKQTAYKKLLDLKLVKKQDKHNYELNNKRFLYIVTDVANKRDLQEVNYQ